MRTHVIRAGFIDEGGLDAAMSGASAKELDTFWSEVAALGTPLVEKDSKRVTFLWRRTPADDVGSVYLFVNRVTDKDNIPFGMMNHVEGTDIWVRTLELTDTTRATYCFRELSPGQVQEVGPPRLERGGMQFDPLNALPPTAQIEGRYGMSVFRARLCPAQPEWESAEALRHEVRGTIAERTAPFPGADGVTEKRCHLYLPAISTGTTELPLLTMFDAEKWFGGLGLPRALDFAIAEGILPPIAVVSVANSSMRDRMESLGTGFDFLSHVVEHLVPWAEELANENGLALAPRGSRERLVAGESLGGLSALCGVLEHPGVWGSAIAQSPSLWRTPQRCGSPLDMQTGGGGEWIIEQFTSPPGVAPAPRIRLSVGTREGPSLPRAHQLALTMKESGWDAEIHVYDGGHDDSCWRGELFAHLAELLRN